MKKNILKFSSVKKFTGQKDLYTVVKEYIIRKLNDPKREECINKSYLE